MPYVLVKILAFIGFSWADYKNNRRSSIAYYLFLNSATLCQIIVLRTAEAELMVLASCRCEIVWARKLAIELGFPQLKPSDVYEDTTGCIALANDMHFRGHIAVRVCFIQKLI